MDGISRRIAKDGKQGTDRDGGLLSMLHLFKLDT